MQRLSKSFLPQGRAAIALGAILILSIDPTGICGAQSPATSSRGSDTSRAESRFPATAFESAKAPERAANPKHPFSGQFRFVDSAFVASNGGSLTVSTGELFILSNGVGAASLVSSRAVEGGILLPTRTREHRLWGHAFEVLSAPDGRVSLVDFWDAPVSGFQTDDGAHFGNVSVTPDGARLVSRMSLTKNDSPLHERTGIYEFRARGTTRSVRAGFPATPRDIEWEGELLVAPADSAGSLLVVLFLRNSGGGSRLWRDVVSIADDTFEFESRVRVSESAGFESLVARFTLRGGRVTATFSRTYFAESMQEQGTGSGTRK